MKQKKHINTGRPVLVTRLFEWMVTVPMLLNLIGAVWASYL